MSTRVKRHSTSDLMDDWLESQGYYRKLIAKDSSCLFRAVSEQLFNTQVLHGDVRNKCADYIEENSTKYAMLVDDRSFENYITILRNPKEWGGQIEIMAMSDLFKCDFSVFQDVGKALYKITENHYDKTVILCQSPGNHYDSVYPNSFIQNAAISQSIVYEILYKKVFALGDEVDFAVSTMLHDKAYAKSRKDSTASIDSNPPLSIFDFGESSDDKDSKEAGSEIRQSLARGFPPFPYKVAKALDPDIYRNVEYDVWNETKKGEIIYEPGVKCLVRLDKENLETYHAHIQEMLPDSSSVTVYIVELGKKQTVAFECLEPLPMCKSPSSYMSGIFYQKQKGNGSPNEMEMLKGKKKLFKKNKYKELQFSVTHPRGQSIPPRFQPQNQQSSINNNANSLGRERHASYPGINNTCTSTSLKWSATSGNNTRYTERVQVQNLPYASQEANFNFKQQSYSRPNERFMVQPASSPTTAGNWNKPNGLITAVNNSRNESIISESYTEPMSQEVPNESLIQGSTNTNTASKSKDVSTTYNSSSKLSAPIASCNQPPLNQENVTANVPPSMVQPSPPFAIYPYQYVGVCLPYESPIHSINYGTPRSRDPQGGDLPLHDLATLRFFFNLGHDYFRSAAIIPMPTNQCQSTVWSYGPQVAYQHLGGYGTPVSSLGNDSESMTESSPHTGTSLTLSDPGCEGLLDNSPKEFYEPTYLYDVSHVNMMPNNFQQQMDFSLPPPPQTSAVTHSGIGEFKGGLVLNEQGILSLNATSTNGITNSHANQPNYQGNTNSSRLRSDSSSSNRSQRNNNSKWNKSSANKSSNANYFNESNAFSASKMEHNNASGNHNQWSPRYPQRVNGSKQTSSPVYANHQVPSHYQAPRHPPPLMPMGTPQHPPNFSLMQTGSPIMTGASPSASLGVYANHGNPTPYYGSPPTQTLYYPHLSQPISYMTTSTM